MRTKILELYPGLVKLTYSTDDGERITRHFIVPDTGGYVREWTPCGFYPQVYEGLDVKEWARRGPHPQVCEGLGRRGATLMASPDTLVSVIRREWRKYRESLI